MKRIVGLAILLVVFVLTAAFHGCAKKEPEQVGVIPTPIGPPPEPPEGTITSKILLVGDVNEVLTGKLAAVNYEELKPADWIAALGVGSLGEKTGTGPMLVMGEKAYVRVPDESAGYPTLSSPMGVNAAFAVAIVKGERPAALVQYPTEKSQSLEQLLDGLTARYSVPVAVLGIGQFLTVEGEMFKEPPVGDQNFRGEEGCQRMLEVRREHEVVAFFAVAATERAGHFTPGKELFARALYHATSRGDVFYHAHGAVIQAIDQDPATLDHRALFARARSAEVSEVFHLRGSSRMLSGTVLVYALTGIHKGPVIGVQVEGGLGMIVPTGR